jgi:hypothetical protein
LPPSHGQVLIALPAGVVAFSTMLSGHHLTKSENVSAGKQNQALNISE